MERFVCADVINKALFIAQRTTRCGAGLWLSPDRSRAADPCGRSQARPARQDVEAAVEQAVGGAPGQSVSGSDAVDGDCGSHHDR